MVKHIWYLIKLLFVSKKKFYYYLYSTLGYLPRDIHLFEIAFTHKSASRKFEGKLINNERLEYLGDAILDAIIADHLFSIYPNEDEGFLTKMKAKIVNRERLNYLAKKIGLQEFIKSQMYKPISKTYINGNAFEAMIGALFLDKGYTQTRKFIVNRVLRKYVDLDNLEYNITDYKSHLLEWSQKTKIEVIIDTVEGNKYTDSKPEFKSTIIAGNNIIGLGMGKSKKEAEQNASKEAINSIGSHHFVIENGNN